MNNYEFLPSLLSDAVTAGCFPSAVAAVGIRDQTLYTCAAGEADLDTRYDMASLTKIMATTMLALRALEDGLLTLGDTLSDYFVAPEDKAGITVLQLMTHTGGFAPTFLLSAQTDDPGDAAGCILRHPLDTPPGAAPGYSCLGFILLGKILESLYGAPLDQLAQAHIFGPLGLRHTGFTPSGSNIAPTEPDPLTGAFLCGSVHDENARFLGGVAGNAGLFSDIHDTIRFAMMLASGGGGFLSPAVLQKAITNHTPGCDTHRGLGFHLGGTPLHFLGDLFPASAYGHTGFTGTSLAIDPQSGLFAILLTNRVHPSRANTRHLRFRRVFHNRIYATFSQTLR